MANAFLILQLISTWFMVGLIWMVQVVHYPMFDRVGLDHFTRYEADHTRLITPIVGVPMLIELCTAIAFLMAIWQHPTQRNWSLLALAMLIIVWLTTALCSVPCHTKLASGFDPQAHRWLVVSNWLRTILWTGRGLILAWLAFQVMSHSPLDRNLVGD